MKNPDEEDQPSSADGPDPPPGDIAGEIGRTVRAALTSRTRTARLCWILAFLGAGIAVPLLTCLVVAMLIVGGR
ncbi:hypothetical protein [Nonomuraea gerenzanensis]|uniref:Uncharacterized protein n=1 Tax=Nonomuraea gerenzanensis TaxID=93944 RepID=A0A1M4E5K8_9ACTN|nr:hypothetical protein [Nonomuraea gerenzanensis]UBU16314.1 hypothetical protein LCN96_15245 [Nonomuraea gerenzanensis]SBO94131.1 hypothetical protein BN4615_P3647 [Nonomuraea gerenzanensis]